MFSDEQEHTGWTCFLFSLEEVDIDWGTPARLEDKVQRQRLKPGQKTTETGVTGKNNNQAIFYPGIISPRLFYTRV